jgi:murein DD-endopeptidase MepM/ murein hydrolase activator NlpD
VVTNSHTGVGVNVRTEPGRASDRIGFLADASALEIVDGPQADAEGDNWYHVSNGSVEGWIAGNLLDRASDAAKAPASLETARFIKPLDKYTLTQNFGCSSLGYYSYNAAYGCNIHDGTDLATSSASDIHASCDGTVVFSGWCDCGLGYYVEIDHGDGIHTVYGHQQVQPPVSVGQVVTQGEVIGYVGSTGLSTGPHVHFMFRVNGTAVNARDYVDL